MDTLLKILIHVAIGSLLLSICIWFGRIVVTSYRKSDMPSEIRPFEVTGGTAGEEKKGLILARMLSARLHNLENEIKLAEQYFGEGENAPSNVTATDFEHLSGKFDVPGGVSEPVNLKMSVANVEVGPLLNWLVSWQGQSHALKLTVDYGKNMVTVFGALGTSGGEQIYLKTPNNEDVELVDQIAYAIAQRPYSKGVPETGNVVLESNVFGEFLNFYIEVAKLIHRARTVDVDVKPQEYETQLNRAAKFTEGPLSKWRWLLHVTGYLAESSKQWDKALSYYGRELALLSGSTADSDKVRRERIEQRVALIRKQALPALPVAVSQGSLEEATRTITDLIGVTGVAQPTSTPTIGIVGGQPLDGTLPDGRLTMLPSHSTIRHSDSASGEDLRNYTSDIIHAAEIVAPRAHFVVAQLPTDDTSILTSELIAGIDLITGSVKSGQRLDALLITFGPLDPITQDLLANLVDLGIPVIVPAGNNPDSKPPFAGDARQAKFAISASATLDRKPTVFTTRGPGVLWVPGTSIPLSEGEKFVLREGGSYSAALLAGIVARIKVLHEAMKPAELVKLLDETSQGPTGTALRVVSLSAALEKTTQRQ